MKYVYVKSIVENGQVVLPDETEVRDLEGQSVEVRLRPMGSGKTKSETPEEARDAYQRAKQALAVAASMTQEEIKQRRCPK